MEPWAAAKESFKLVWRCHKLLYVFLVKGQRVSLLPNEENPGKFQLGDSLMKAVRPVIASNGVPYLQTKLTGSHCMSGRVTDGKKGGTEWGLISVLLN